MKQLLLITALLATISTANANGNYLQPSASASNALAISSSSQTQNNAIQGDSVRIDQEKPAASSAISPSVGTSNDCQIATPASKSVSILLISVSGTTGVSYNGLCFAYKMKQFDVAERMMCKESAEYAKANPNCK